MRARTILLSFLLCGTLATISSAQVAHMGTWKLNEIKSRLAPGAPKYTMVVCQAAGDNVKVTIDGVDGEGNPVHTEWTGRFDGQDYPVTGDPTSDARSYKKIDDNTLQLTVKKGDTIIRFGRIVVSADGKSRTVALSGTDRTGKKFRSTAEYDKQ